MTQYTPEQLASLPPDQAMEWLRQNFSKLTPSQTGEMYSAHSDDNGNLVDPRPYFTDPSIAEWQQLGNWGLSEGKYQGNTLFTSPGVFGGQYQTSENYEGPVTTHTGYQVDLTPSFRDQQGYGRYVGVYDAQGNLSDVKRQTTQLSKGWFGENISTWGPLLVMGAAAAAGLLGGGGVGAGASTGGAGGTIGSAAPLGSGLSAGSLGSGLSAGSLGSGLSAGSLGTGLTAGAGGVTGLTAGTSAGAAVPAAASTGGLLSGATNALTGMLGGAGSWLAPALGAAAGLASSGEKTAEQTSTRLLDPDVRSLYFGDGGLIPTAKALYAQNPTGMNDMRSGALNNLAGFFNSDAYLAPYQQQAQIANQMLGSFNAPQAPAARAPVQGWGYNPAALLMPR